MQLHTGNKLQTSKMSWVFVSDGFIYISRDNNRVYWILRKIKPQDRPKITFNDKTQTFRIATNKIVVTEKKKYNIVKTLLEPYNKNKSFI